MTIVHCSQCGKKIYRSTDKLKRNNHNFCSRPCYGMFYKGIKRTIITKIRCDECGKVFDQPSCLVKAHLKRGKQHYFCSRKCYGEYRSKTFIGSKHPQWKGMTAKCRECGKVFHTRPNRLNNGRGRFCSKKCLYQHQSKIEKITRRGEGNPAWVTKIISSCPNCGARLEITPIAFDKSKFHFCSMKCRFEYLSGARHPSWKGGDYPEYYGPNWREQKRKTWKRDNDICQQCGASAKELGKKPDVHHIIPFREFGISRYKDANRLENLILLCHSCHQSIEQNSPILKVHTKGDISVLDA